MNGIVFSVLGAILLGLGAYRQYCLCVCSSKFSSVFKRCHCDSVQQAVPLLLLLLNKQCHL